VVLRPLPLLLSQGYFYGHWFSLMGTAKFRGFVGKLG
jgi:hypothetical protein